MTLAVALYDPCTVNVLGPVTSNTKPAVAAALPAPSLYTTAPPGPGMLVSVATILPTKVPIKNESVVILPVALIVLIEYIASPLMLPPVRLPVVEILLLPNEPNNAVTLELL